MERYFHSTRNCIGGQGGDDAKMGEEMFDLFVGVEFEDSAHQLGGEVINRENILEVKKYLWTVNLGEGFKYEAAFAESAGTNEYNMVFAVQLVF